MTQQLLHGCELQGLRGYLWPLHCVGLVGTHFGGAVLGMPADCFPATRALSLSLNLSPRLVQAYGKKGFAEIPPDATLGGWASRQNGWINK